MTPGKLLWTSARASMLLVSLFTTAGLASAQEFSYSGDFGPGFWDDTPGWEACKRSTEPGARQSPIDIRHTTADPRLHRLDLHILATEVSLINNGHTIEQEYQNGSQLIVDSAVYELQQFHLHTLSEHVMKGHRGVLELHAVFKNKTDDTMAVIGVIYWIGQSSRFLDRLMSAGLPAKAGEEIHSSTEIDLADGLTDTAAYYTYAGSLTTPPCSETVTWFVLKHPATLSEAQFRSLNRILGDNFRPLRERNGRVIRATVSQDHD